MATDTVSSGLLSDVEELLAAAGRAPSVHNTQPWAFRVVADRVEVWADPARQLRTADPLGRELAISCGAALYTLRLAARQHRLVGRATLLPDPEQPRHLGSVTLRSGPPPTAPERRLYAAVPRRHTHRGPFSDRPLDPALRAELTAVAAVDGARLRFVARPSALGRLAELTRLAQRVQSDDPAWRAEVTAWTPSPGSARRDGVPATAYEAHPTPSLDGLPPRDFDLHRDWGRERSTRASGGSLALLSTDGDLPRHWLRAGMALQHLALRAAADWAFATYYTQALELPQLRAVIRMETDRSSYPQMLLRLGYAGYAPSTPRRPVAELLRD